MIENKIFKVIEFIPRLYTLTILSVFNIDIMISFDITPSQAGEFAALVDKAQKMCNDDGCSRHINAQVTIYFGMVTIKPYISDWFDSDATVRTIHPI